MGYPSQIIFMTMSKRVRPTINIVMPPKLINFFTKLEVRPTNDSPI